MEYLLLELHFVVLNHPKHEYMTCTYFVWDYIA